MKTSRRNFLHLAAGSCRLSSVSHVARLKPIRRAVRLLFGYIPAAGTHYRLRS